MLSGLRSQSSLIGEQRGDGLGGCRTAVHAELLEDRSQPLPRVFGPATLVHRGEVVAAQLYGAAAGWHGDYDQLSWLPKVCPVQSVESGPDEAGRSRLDRGVRGRSPARSRSSEPNRRGAADSPANVSSRSGLPGSPSATLRDPPTDWCLGTCPGHQSPLPAPRRSAGAPCSTVTPSTPRSRRAP